MTRYSYTLELRGRIRETAHYNRSTYNRAIMILLRQLGELYSNKKV
jgi:hypothetical protein